MRLFVSLVSPIPVHLVHSISSWLFTPFTVISQVKQMSNDVIHIVANITGAPSVDSFRNGFELLVPQDLKQMRALFRNMGLK